MRVVSVVVLATAVLTSSAPAASLDVKPIESTTTTAPVVQIVANSSSNTTSDGKIGIQDHKCSAMSNANWDDFKYACSWYHDRPWFVDWFNMFFMRWDGSVVYECGCEWGLRTYNPWHPRWTYSDTYDVKCYSRDGKSANEIKHVFDNYSCDY